MACVGSRGAAAGKYGSALRSTPVVSPLAHRKTRRRMSPSPPQVIERDAFDGLFEALARRGYTVVGPTVRDQAIVYDELRSSADLPVGWTDEQDGGHYRLRRRDDEALFGYAVGPHAWKRYQLPPDQRLWSARRDARGGLTDVEVSDGRPERYAFLGARSCELHAMGILERVILRGGRADPREGAFIVAVNCGQAAATCFCVSMETGPKATAGYDLALTEVLDGGRHYFVVDVGSDRGGAVLDELAHAQARAQERARAEEVHAHARAGMGRELDVTGIKELLYRNVEHPRWEDVADRCMTCGNCTMVCPTCFCTTVEDTTDLTGEHVERHQRWDSCFTVDYSHIHGGAVRGSARSRYRQWMTHKLATWIDQFGSSGCVGCGRCITWCPVGIDITEEASAIRESDAGP
jgi:sulfhydrogenase subunit beta (sulfur reductase)